MHQSICVLRIVLCDFARDVILDFLVLQVQIRLCCYPFKQTAVKLTSVHMQHCMYPGIFLLVC